jgi:predicted ATP-grasp superfamily ATP-dependent carboligase
LATVLIPDPVDFAQTAALRALGRRGDVCDVLCPPNSAKVNGKFCRQVLVAPAPGAGGDAAGFTGAVLALARRHDYDVILPTRGTSLEALVQHREALSLLVGVLMPSPEQFQLGNDKRRTVEFCRAHGIAHPETLFVPPDPGEVARAAQSLGFPTVIKHPRNFGGSLGVRMVRDAASLQSALQELTHLPTATDDLMIQRYLPGAIYDACLVAKDGVVAGLVTQERRLMYPVSGGVAGVLATVDIPQLTALSHDLVRLLRWNGPAQIEFKWDPQLQAFSLIELNPRFWATTGAWLKAGANFPGLAVDLAMRRVPQPFPRVPAGLRFKYMIGRSSFALWQLWRAKGLSALRDSRRYSRTWYDFDLSDPLPDLYRFYCESRNLLTGRRSLYDHALAPEHIPAYEPEPAWGGLGQTASPSVDGLSGASPVSERGPLQSVPTP